MCLQWFRMHCYNATTTATNTNSTNTTTTTTTATTTTTTTGTETETRITEPYAGLRVWDTFTFNVTRTGGDHDLSTAYNC